MPTITITKKTEWQVLVNQLKRQLETPTAILVLGGNDEAAERVVTELKRRLNNIKNGNMLEVHNYADVGSIASGTFADGTRKRLFVRLARGSSADRNMRDRVMQKMHDIGAKSIVALWVKGNPEVNNQNAQAVDEALHADPPTIEDGFDRIYTWAE